MKLYIDTSSNQKTIVKLDDKVLEKITRQWPSQVVLPMIQKLLGRRPLSAISKIEVNPGPGSFTGLRVGVAIANALGFALGVPVNGKRVDRLEIVEPQYELVDKRGG